DLTHAGCFPAGPRRETAILQFAAFSQRERRNPNMMTLRCEGEEKSASGVSLGRPPSQALQTMSVWLLQEESARHFTNPEIRVVPRQAGHVLSGIVARVRRFLFVRGQTQKRPRARRNSFSVQHFTREYYWDTPKCALRWARATGSRLGSAFFFCLQDWAVAEM